MCAQRVVPQSRRRRSNEERRFSGRIGSRPACDVAAWCNACLPKSAASREATTATRNAIEAIPDTIPAGTNEYLVSELLRYVEGNESYRERLQRILTRGSGNTGMLFGKVVVKSPNVRSKSGSLCSSRRM